jgi:hypothetical protein
MKHQDADPEHLSPRAGEPLYTLVAHPHSRCVYCKKRVSTPSGAGPRALASGLHSHYRDKHGFRLPWNRRLQVILIPWRQ